MFFRKVLFLFSDVGQLWGRVEPVHKTGKFSVKANWRKGRRTRWVCGGTRTVSVSTAQIRRARARGVVPPSGHECGWQARGGWSPLGDHAPPPKCPGHGCP